MIILNNLEVIEAYKSYLQGYTLEQLSYILEEGVWSIGQMYDHLIVVAHEYLDCMEICAAGKEEQPLGKTEFGQLLFDQGEFQPIKIRLPDELNQPPNNTDTIIVLSKRLDGLLERMKEWAPKLDVINPNYKVKHDGFGWLNAREWYELVGMHSRHHLRQKSELEQKLGLTEMCYKY